MGLFKEASEKIMFFLIISFCTGILTKLVDLTEEHGYKMNKFIKVLISVSYGLLLAYWINNAPLTSFWFGILIGLILSGKIDAQGHFIAVSVTFLTLSFLGFNQMNAGIVILTTLVCWVEEWVNDEIVDKGKVKGFFKQILEFRPLVEIMSLILSFVYKNMNIFYILFMYDVGYSLTNRYKSIILKKD